MKLFQTIRRMLSLIAALILFLSVCNAEEGTAAFRIDDAGLDLADDLSIHYPVLSNPGDMALTDQINSLIREKCRIGDYLSRAAQLLSGGRLTTEWKGEMLNDIFSCAVSASGALTDSRPTHVWTAVTPDLRDGHEVTLAELFTDEEEARERIEMYLEESVAPELSPHLQNSELIPLPETFYLDRSGLTLLYPIGQLSTLSDRAGDIRIGWNEIRDELDLSEDSILNRIGAGDMINLSAETAEQLRAAAAEGLLTGIPAKIGDSMQELTDRWHLLTDPDGFESGRLFSLEGGCFRGIFLMTDDLSRDWQDSRVQGIRMDQGCEWGLCLGDTTRTEWLSELGEPDGTAEVGEEKAEANRIVPGTCDYYCCGEYLLQLYSDYDGILVSIVLTE